MPWLNNGIADQGHLQVGGTALSDGTVHTLDTVTEYVYVLDLDTDEVVPGTALDLVIIPRAVYTRVPADTAPPNRLDAENVLKGTVRTEVEDDGMVRFKFKFEPTDGFVPGTEVRLGAVDRNKLASRDGGFGGLLCKT